jgi:hypothetical protein
MVPSLHDKLVKRAEVVRTAAERMAERTYDWQMIRDFISNRIQDIPLTAQQEKKLERYQYIYNQMVSGKYTKNEILNQLINKKLFGISLQQAYEDLDCAQELWNTVINVKRNLELSIELEINRALRRNCVEVGDLKTAATFSKEINSLMKLMPEEEDTTADLFEGHIIEAVFDPTLLGAPEIDMREILEMINAKRKAKINIDMFATDISHEDVTNANETTPL